MEEFIIVCIIQRRFSKISDVVRKLTKLPVLVITTHVHWDHIGGHSEFEHIAVYEAEREWIADRFPIPLPVVKRNLCHGTCEFPDDFEIDDYQVYQGEPEMMFHDGDQIE